MYVLRIKSISLNVPEAIHQISPSPAFKGLLLQNTNFESQLHVHSLKITTEKTNNEVYYMGKSTWAPTHYSYRSYLAMKTHDTKLPTQNFCADARGCQSSFGAVHLLSYHNIGASVLYVV